MIDDALVTLIHQYVEDSVPVMPSNAVGTTKVTDVLPKIIYTLIDLQREYTDDGQTGLPTAQYQLDIFAQRMSTARALADALRVGLDGYYGTTDSVFIRRISFPAENFARAELVTPTSSGIARLSQDVVIVYREQT